MNVFLLRAPRFFLGAVAAGFFPHGARADTVGVPWTGQPGITKSVDSIMAGERQRPAAGLAPAAIRTKPVLRPNRLGLPQNPGSATGAPTPARAAAQNSRGSSLLRNPRAFSPQTLGTSFTGATLADTNAFPPDTMGAAGPTQFIVAVNGRIRTFNKATGLADGALDAGMDTFFSSVTTPVGGGIVGNFTSDPHIRYDRLSGRWFVVMIDVPYTSASPFTTAENRVMIAMSSGGTVANSSSFTFFQFRHDQPSTAGDSGTFADYPTPGIDANAIYIGDNLFSNSTGSFVGCSGFVVRKSSLTGGGPIVVTAFRGLVPTASAEGPNTPQGVDNFDAAATEGYFVGVSNASFGRLVVRRVSNPGGTPSISGNLLVPVNSTVGSINVQHLGNTGGDLDGLDDRLFAAHLRNGRLWTAHNIEVNASGVATAGGGRNGSRWYELQNLSATPSVRQSGTVFDSTAVNPKSYWIPSIMVSGQGHAAMGFSTAGPAHFANAGTVGRLTGDTLGTMQTPVNYTAATTAYNPGDTSFPRRWGDYSYTSLDPSDDMTMWTIQEFCNAATSYGVRVVKLIAPPPATFASVSPASVPHGLASVSVTVTGNQVSGSGYYDPGTGFANRLVGAVSGGVVVNSVTYNSPTSVTLNLNTTAAFTGARDITLTNPDGQSLLASMVLTITPTFSSWQQDKFTAGELANASVSGAAAVFGLDGLPNLVKYALGLEPKQNITTGLPDVTVVGAEWVFTYTRPSSITDVTYAVEFSSDLANWTTAGVTHELVSAGGGIDTWRGRYPLGSAGNAFFRLKVTQP